MPSLSSLVDNFNDNATAPDWGNSYGGVSESGGTAHVPCGTGFAGYQTAYSWTLAGSSFYVAVVQLPDPTGASAEAYASIFVNHPQIEEAESPFYGTRIGFMINTVSGMMRLASETEYWDDDAVTLTYSDTDHAFLRLREEDGTVYWDTSPDGVDWTNRRTLTTPAWITSGTDLGLDMSAHRDGGDPDEVEYDNFNTLSDGAVYTGAATGSAESAATAAGILSAAGSGSGSAQSDSTGDGITIAYGSATGSAHSDASATGEGDVIPEVAALSAGVWDLVIEQGATFVQTYTVADDPEFTWDGWSARAQIRSAPADSGDLLIDLTDYLTILGGAIRLAIPASVTQTLTRNGVWDLEVVQGSTVVRLLNGKAILSPEVTRA